jgi:glycine/D-amino acid oxidase-like deaminating enzyme
VKPVVVVGGGIVGACVAYRLAAVRVPVTVVFRDGGVTPLSFGWIGSAPPWPGGSDVLSRFIRTEWLSLASDVPGVDVHWSGSVVSGRLVPDDGAVDPVAVTRALLLAARGLGARIVSGASVTSVRDGVVSSSAGDFPASTVVVAAGTGTTRLCPSVAVPASPAFRMRVRAPRGSVRTIVATNHFDVREAGPGLLLATAPLGPDRSWTGLRTLAGQTTDRLRSAFGGELRLIDWAVGERPMPPDGPVIGWVTPGVYVAVMHSAICLAPVAGRLIADEIVTGEPSPTLARCRPA